jgi:transposase
MIKYRVTLTAEERAELEAIAQKGSHASQKVVNALILLNCDESEFQDRRMKNEDVAAVLKISMRKIDRLKKRFVEEGVEAALERRKSERIYEKKADGDFEARLVALSCSAAPKGFARWSLRLLADRAVELQHIDSVSYETVRRVLKKTSLSLGKNKAG